MVAALLLAALVVQSIDAAPTSPSASRAPSAIVERLFTSGRSIVRLSLFDNRVAVVTMSEDGRRIFFRKLTLEEAEFDVYLTAVVRDAAEIAPEGRRPSGVGGAGAVIRLDLGERAPREVRYATGEVLDLATARLVTTLDDLERRVSETSPSHEELRHWRPTRGDLVELFSGRRAVVSEVRDDGSIVLEHEGGAIIEVLSEEGRSQRILRVVEEGR